MAFRLLLLTFLFPVWTTTGQASAQHILGTVIALDTKDTEVKIPNGALVSVKLIGQVRPKDNSQSNEPPAAGNRVFIEESKKRKC